MQGNDPADLMYSIGDGCYGIDHIHSVKDRLQTNYCFCFSL